jgi:hypothetical protein
MTWTTSEVSVAVFSALARGYRAPTTTLISHRTRERSWLLFVSTFAERNLKPGFYSCFIKVSIGTTYAVEDTAKRPTKAPEQSCTSSASPSHLIPISIPRIEDSLTKWAHIHNMPPCVDQ